VELLPVRRRAFALIALGFVFLPLALVGPHHHRAYAAIGLCFMIAGVALIKRSRRTP